MFKKQKNTTVAIVAVIFAAILVIALVMVCMNFYSTKESNDGENIFSSTASETVEENDASNNNSNQSETQDNAESTDKKSTEADDKAQKIAILTEQIRAKGFTTVAQGEVRQHTDQYSGGTTQVTYFIRLNEPLTINGYQTQNFTSHSTQTLIATTSNKGKFKNEDTIKAYFANMVGKKVLVGFNDGTEDVAFASGSPCGFALHSSSECELSNAGHPTYLTDLEIMTLN